MQFTSKYLELKKIDEINFYPIEIINENNFKFETKNKLNIGISWSEIQIIHLMNTGLFHLEISRVF